jgi:hypothetical protein
MGMLGLALLLALVLAWRWVAGRHEGLGKTLGRAALWRLRRGSAEAR